MKNILLLLTITFSIFSFGQTINIPDTDLNHLLVTFPTTDTDGDGFADSVIDLNNDGLIQISEANLVDNLEISGSSYQFTDLSGLDQFSNLTELIIRSNDQFPGFSNLIFSNLEKFTCRSCGSFTLSNLNSIPAIEELMIPFDHSITSLDLSNNTSISKLELRLNSNFTNLTLTTSLLNVDIDRGFDPINYNGILNLLNAPNLESLVIPIELVDQNSFTHLINLEEFTISSDAGTSYISSITSIDFSFANNLRLLSLGNLPNLTSVTLSNNNLLEEFDIFGSNISTLDLTNNVLLKDLALSNSPNLLALPLTQLVNLERLGLSDLPMWTTLDISSNTNLKEFRVGLSNINILDITSNPDLEFLILGDLSISQIDLSGNPLLQTFGLLSCNNLIELDFSNNPRVNLFNINNNNSLEYINLKNNSDILSNRSSSFFRFDGNFALNSICVNDRHIFNMENVLQNFGYFSVNVNSYCSFTPGGNFSEIQGAISIDTDNNGCDPTDPVFSNFNFTATDGTLSGSISSDQSGNYYVPVSDGQHIITPNPENPTYWNFTPANVVVDFPTQASPFTQDFCVTANGSIEDLEVIVVPLEQARPGFDTDYKVVVKNKGNVTTSGTVNLDFEEDFMSLLSSAPTAAMPASNQLSWSVSNLQPFQMEEYEFTMTLNTPTQTTNPLNGGDLLTFTGTVIGTATDAMPADNTMVFDQTVVNSYDPNDKTCLEGETITPAMVGEYVHYMIRFENTGSASAVNIVVKDEIDLSQFDITTLIPLGGSHDYYTRVRDGNVVEFIHENINLDFNDATNDGFVLFKIKTLSTLLEGDTFDNSAEIYFDFNAPIITNTETVTVMNTASIAETTDASITVYPNPARDYIQISSSNGLKSASIIDVNGRMLSQTNFIGSLIEQRISTQNLNSGVYFISIQSEVGQKVQKVIVE